MGAFKIDKNQLSYSTIENAKINRLVQLSDNSKTQLFNLLIQPSVLSPFSAMLQKISSAGVIAESGENQF
jgi:hypothetical protein